MKHRDIFRAPARIEHRTRTARAWKDANGQTQTEQEDLGWFIVLRFGGQDFSFRLGDSQIKLQSPTASLAIEYETEN